MGGKLAIKDNETLKVCKKYCHIKHILSVFFIVMFDQNFQGIQV